MNIIKKIFKESPARITNILLTLSFVAYATKIISTAIKKQYPLSFIAIIYDIASLAVYVLIIIYTSYYYETDRTQILFPIAFIIKAAMLIPFFINTYILLCNYSYSIGSFAIFTAINILFFLTYSFTAFSAFKKFKWIIIAEVSYAVIFLYYMYPIPRFVYQIYIYIKCELAASYILSHTVHEFFSITAAPLFTAGILLFFLLNISKLGKKNKASTTADTQKLEQQLFSIKQHESGPTGEDEYNKQK